MKRRYLFVSCFVLAVIAIFCFSGCSFLNRMNNQNNNNYNNKNNKKYFVTFNVENIPAMTFTEPTVIKESDVPVPTEEKRAFVGWYLDENLSEKVVFPYNLNKEVTFFAKWEDMLCLSVVRDGNAQESRYYPKSSIIKEKDIKEPEYADKIFQGWYLEPEYITKVTFPYEITEDVTFYAKMGDKNRLTLKDKNNILDVNYYASGTSVEEKDIIIPPAEDGYYFESWYSDVACKTKVEFPYEITKDTTFYAKWKEVKVSSIIKFETNTFYSVQALHVYTGDKIGEKNVPQLSSATKDFVGWYLDSGFTQKVVFPFVVNDGALTFYAKWEDKVALNLIFDGSDKNTIRYKKNSVIESSDLEIPTKENKIFAGWYADEELTEAVSFPFTISEETSFYAKWEDETVDNTVKVSFETNATEQINTLTFVKGSVLNEGNIKKINSENKVLVGWYLESDFINKVTFPLTISEDLTLYAKWEDKIILNLQKTDSDITTLYFIKDESVSSSDFEIPSLENMIFSGWYLDSECKNAVKFPYTVTTNTTFYAKWTEKEVILKIVFNTNVSEVLSPMSLKKGTVVNESNIKTITVENKTFLGWYSNADFSTKVVFPFIIEKDVILYAKWQDYIHLAYETNCDTALEEDIFTNITSIDLSDIKVLENSLEREFLGWYSDSSLQNPVTYPYTLNKDTTFYAKWKINDVCTIKYYIDNKVCYYVFQKNTIVKLEDLETEYEPYYAKKFKGFYLDDKFTNKVEFPLTITENLNLYILWEEFYVITFDTNGGTEIEKSVGEVYLISYPYTKKFGYKAVGLSTDKEGKNLIKLPFLVPESGITLYVVWEKLPDTKYKVTFDESVPGNYEPLYVSVLTEDILPTPYKEGYKFIEWKFYLGRKIEFPYQMFDDKVIEAVFEKDILRNGEGLKMIKRDFKGLSRHFLSMLYDNYGIGGDFGFSYGEEVQVFIHAKNYTPDETTDEYIIENILTNGTCFDALRYNVLDYSSVDALKNNTNSFRYKVTIDLDKWWNWNIDYPDGMMYDYTEEYAEDYLISFYDNNYERMQYELLCYMLDKKDRLNDFSSERLEELYNEYLQVYTYFGFSVTDAVKIRELLMSIAPETYDDSILNYTQLVESFLDTYILSDDAMYKEESALSW